MCPRGRHASHKRNAAFNSPAAQLAEHSTVPMKQYADKPTELDARVESKDYTARAVGTAGEWHSLT